MQNPDSLKSKQDYVEYFRGLGFNVIPCQPRKKEPAVAWKKYQTEKYTDGIPDENNIAVICGSISNDLFVVDLDAPELIRDFEILKSKTLIVQSGSGGYHIYCKPNGDKPYTMRFSNEKGQHVDIQSDGAYVLAPPSIHPDSGEEYKIVSSTLDIGYVSLAAILHKLKQHGFETKQGSKPLSEIMKGVGEGERNANAFKYACYLLQKAEFDQTTAWHEMQRWNEKNHPPLPEKELDTIFESASRYEKPTAKEKEKTHDQYAAEIKAHYHFLTIEETREILYYDCGVYKRGGETLIAAECQRLIPECSRYMVNEVTGTIERSTYRKLEMFDADPAILNCRNCLVNIRDGVVTQHSPDILSMIQLPVNYDPAKIPRMFNMFLRQCLKNPRDVYSVWEHFAACLIKSTKFEKAFMYVGSGANGKSTFLYVVESVLGRQNVSHISIHELDEGRFSKAELVGKMANIYADISNAELRNVGVLKIMISGDRVTVEKKNKNPFSMENFAKLFFSANQIPEVYDDSDGFFRRFMIIEWKTKFSQKIANPNLKHILTSDDEMSGILNMLIAVGRLLDARGYFKYSDTVEELRKVWKDKSNSVESFYNNEVVLDVSYRVEKSKFYNAYLDYCKDRNLPAQRPRMFYDIISKITVLEDEITRINDKSTRVWAGGMLRKDYEELLKKRGQLTIK